MKNNKRRTVQPDWRRTVIATSLGFASVGVCAQMAEPQGESQAGRTKTTMVIASGDAQIEAQFDPDVMRERGLDPAIAEYFRRAPRFPPGPAVVQLTVNGQALGRRSVTFGAQGQLCFTPAFVKAIGLLPMPDTAAAQSSGASGVVADPGMAGASVSEAGPVGMGASSPESACPDYRDFAPRTVLSLQPASGAVDIVTPAEFVTVARAPTESGGVAGLFNYRVFDLESGFGQTHRNSFRQLDSVAGFNVDDWIFRSHQLYSGSTGASRLYLQETYAQRTFVDQRQILQVGRNWTQSPLFSGIAFAGGQWFPESALNNGGGVAVTGMASTRSVVEVRQNGVLLYSTVVPAGPFSLTEVPIHTNSADLQVRVIDASGAVQDSVVPAASLLGASDNTIAKGLSVSAGRLWDPGEASGLRGSSMLTAANGWNYGGRLSGVTGGLLARGYGSVGAAMNARLGEGGQSVYVQTLASRDTGHSQSGMMGSAAYALTLSPGLSMSLSGNLRTLGYRTVQEAESSYPYTDFVSYRTQLGASVTWNTGGRLGGVSAGVSRQTYFNSDSGYLFTLGWDVSIGPAQLSVGVSYNTARNNYVGNYGNLNSDPLSAGGPPGVPGLGSTGPGMIRSNNYIFVNLTIPLGHQITSNSYVRNTNASGRAQTVVGTGIEQSVNDTFGYGASVQKDPRENGRPDTTLTAYVTPRYTSLGFGADDGVGNRSFYGQANGGVMVNGAGVAFSPYAVQDTFGLVKLGDMAGIRVDTPGGPVWSGYRGLAAVPSLLPFHESRIEVAGDSLPSDVDVDNGLQIVQAARGAVVSVAMGANRVHRVLLSVTAADGSPLPAGLPVLRGEGEFFTATLTDGLVMVTDLREKETYSVQMPTRGLCTLKNIRFSEPVNGEQFGRGTAQCE